MPENKWPDLFRFYDTIGPEGVTIECQRYIVISETPQCYYVIKDHLRGYSDSFKKEKRKRVLKSAGGRRLCYQDKAEAMRSYKARKAWQISHAELSLERAKAAKATAELMLATPELISGESVICEGGEYIKQLSWGDY